MSETISAPTAEPGAAPVIPLPNVTEHPEPGGRELDDANVLCRGVIRVEPPTQELVELLGSLDVGHGDDVDLEVYGDSRYAGVRLLLFHAGAGLSRATWRRARRCVRSTAPAPVTWGRSRPAPARSAR